MKYGNDFTLQDDEDPSEKKMKALSLQVRHAGKNNFPVITL